MTDTLKPYREGMEYGIGMDTPSADARNTAVLGEPTVIPNAGGSITQFALTMVSTDEDLQTALGISASVTGGFGPCSASASMEFARKCHVHSNSVFLLASVTVTLAFAQIKSPKITPEAAAKLTDGDPSRFQEMYGDSFVRGMQTGGRFYAMVEIKTSDRTEQEKVAVAVEGCYGPFSAEASFSNEFRKTVNERSLRITTHTEGGVVQKQPTSLEDVQAVASGFAATVEGHAVPYAVLLDKYSILDLPRQPNYIDLQHQMDVLTYCAQKRNRIWTEINNVEFILANRGQFSDTPDTDDWSSLTTYLESLRADLDVVTKAASHALDHPSEAAMPSLAAIAPTLPKRKQGVLDSAAESGAAAANADPVARALRDTLTSTAAIEGFNIGMEKERQFTLWGPGQQQFKDSLDEEAQRGFQLAADHCLNRNNNPERAAKGQAVVLADPEALAARTALPVTQWLGFNVASAIFGNPALGAQGNTLMGPGSQKVRDSLIADGPAGFDSAVQYHMAKKYV